MKGGGCRKAIARSRMIPLSRAQVFSIQAVFCPEKGIAKAVSKKRDSAGLTVQAPQQLGHPHVLTSSIYYNILLHFIRFPDMTAQTMSLFG